MLVYTLPVYKNALIDLNLDPETYPLKEESRKEGWGATATFESTFAAVPLGVWENWKGVSNVGAVLDVDTAKTLSSKLDASNVKLQDVSIKSDFSNSVTIMSAGGVLNLIDQSKKMTLQVKSYGSSIKSNSATKLNSETSMHNTEVAIPGATAMVAKVEEMVVDSKVTSYTVSHKVKEYTLSVVS